ncbi:MAG: hypothetical protein JWP91_2086 [Fibrobacteres bacterium]|nr:hypothetical protein [Fibrobacterota bacterium]
MRIATAVLSFRKSFGKYGRNGFAALALASAAAIPALADIEAPIKWACIGNSITAGPSATDAYSAKLQNLLGPAFLVENDGVSGRTLLKKGDFSYWTLGRLTNVFAFQPDIISIKLGTNDSKPVNWDTHKGEFEGDLLALIDTLSAMKSHPKIFLVLPCPAFVDQTGSAGIRGTVIKNEIMPIIKKVAAARNLNIIDAYTPLLPFQSLFADGVHPNAVGHDSLASIFYRTFLSKATRIACVGNSITDYAFGTPGTVKKDSYPMRLNMLFGRDYFVQNDGVSGAYMTRNSLSPYYKTSRFPDIFKLKPNLVTIKLGTNDSRPQYWNKNVYMADYRWMLDTLATLNPKPKVVLLLPCPSFKRNGEYQFQNINDSIIVNFTIPAIKQIAAERGLTVIDLHTPMEAHGDLVPDGVHPNAEGQDSLAHIIFRVLNAPTAVSGPIAPKTAAYPEITLAHGILTVTVPAAGAAGAGAAGAGAAGAETAPIVARLYDISGRQASETTLKSGQAGTLSLAGYPPGRYFLTVRMPGGMAVKVLSVEPGAP